MLITAPVNAQLATAAARRVIQAGNAGIAAPGAVAAVSAISPESAGRDGNELLHRLAGRVLPAVVLARLDDTRGIVDIAGERYSVAARLPENGQAVMLRFAASAAGSNATAAAVAAANAAAASAAPMAAAAPERAAQVMLGSLAQQLSEVASTDARPLTLGAVAASVQSAPAFAAALSALIRDSGMFYESHVARWCRGQYPLNQLRREPQAVSASASGAVAAAVSMPGNDSAARIPAATPAPATLVPAELQSIVREQLEMLDHRSLSVTIDAWPGQTVLLEMRQQIDQDRPRQETEDGASDAALWDSDAALWASDAALWATRLALELPRLGKLEARIALAGDRLQLVFHAAPALASQLGAHTNLLGEALAAAGIRLYGLRIQP